MFVVAVFAGWMLAPRSDASTTPFAAAFAVAIIAALGVGSGLMVFSRMARASVDAGRIRLRHVLSSPREIAISDIDEVVCFRRFLLLARMPTTPATRFVLRNKGRTIAAFTPSNDEATRLLTALRSIPTIIEEQPLSSFHAWRRYRTGISFSDVAITALPWAATVIGVGVMVWIFLIHANR